MRNEYRNPEDLLIDSTFQKYCAGNDKPSKAYWEKWINENTDKRELFDAAISLYNILNGNKKPVDQQLMALRVKLETSGADKVISFNRKHLILKVAATVVLFMSVWAFIHYQSQESAFITNRTFVYTASKGEKRKIVLQDGTQVLLNSASKLTVYKNFNKDAREVFLSGEGFFDVAHNPKKPFKLLTEKFNVSVLGTAFNVKTYHSENIAEVTLLRGAITMEDKRNPGSLITIRPSQKVTVYSTGNNEKVLAGKYRVSKNGYLTSGITINHYTLSRDSSVEEIAWSKNRIVINDQSFADIKPILERWYNVNIRFTSQSIINYQFTATFNNESITDVLNALQKAHQFKYTINNNQIFISK